MSERRIELEKERETLLDVNQKLALRIEKAEKELRRIHEKGDDILSIVKSHGGYLLPFEECPLCKPIIVALEGD